MTVHRGRLSQKVRGRIQGPRLAGSPAARPSIACAPDSADLLAPLQSMVQDLNGPVPS